MPARLQFDEVGPWTEIKQTIIQKYARAYSTILAKQAPRFHTSYVDAFSGPGVQISRSTREVTSGSPKIALAVEPPFDEFHFIDLDGGRARHLARLVGSRPDVHVYEGDCNSILLTKVFPLMWYEDYRRCLCLLDPKGLHLDWASITEAGRKRTIEVFLNFPVMDMNRNAIWRDLTRVPKHGIARMTAFWGDESWQEKTYEESAGLFGPVRRKLPNEEVALAFRRRLQEVAGFRHVPRPLPMRNSRGAVVYYLFFASHNKNGARIAKDIFRKYHRG